MSANTITMTSQLQCPHGGQVIIQSSNPVKVMGVPVPTLSDQFMIVGCAYQMSTPGGPVPSPCVEIQWLQTNLFVKVNGVFPLNQTSVGLCLSATKIPQGTVSIMSTQTYVKSR